MAQPRFEFRILQGFPNDVQKVLNQWRNDYVIDILKMSNDGNNLFLLVKRSW